MQSYDVVVCGAGPAGAIAAATAAQAGLKVALLEKQVLPRHKTCGGGVPMVMQDHLRDLAPEAFVESDVRFMRHTWQFADPFLMPINSPDSEPTLSIWMVQRPIFDDALAQRAAKFGAELLDGVAMRSLSPESDGVIIRAQSTQSGREFTAKARYVIGADGANGVTVKATNLRKKPAIALGLEVELPHTWGEGHADLRPEVLHLEYGAVKRGYAWIFPKADHLNIGAGVFSPTSKDARSDRNLPETLKQCIFDYIDAVGVKCDRDSIRFHGHPLPTWRGKEPLQEGRILLAGDAAGLINPLFGDGILHAVKSGEIAARCVVENAVERYSDRIHAEFATNFDAALNLARVFYQWTGLCYKYGVKYEKTTRYATQLLCGDLLFSDMAGRAMRRLKRSVGGNFFPSFNG